MEKFNTNTVVIGAGVVGLAIAKEISAKNNEVIILEKEGQIGQITSSRNSGVIHAGMYYQSNSLKSKFFSQPFPSLNVSLCNFDEPKCSKLFSQEIVSLMFFS